VRVTEALGLPPHPVALANLALVRRAEHDLDGARSGLQDAVQRARRTGDKYALAAALLGLGCLAADLGDWHRAAMMHGAEHALADQIGARSNPFDARFRQEASTRPAPPSATSNSSRPTLAARHSASTKPSASPSGKPPCHVTGRTTPHRSPIPAWQRHPPWQPGLPIRRLRAPRPI